MIARTNMAALRRIGDDPDEQQIRQLIHRIREGDERALAELISRHRSQVAALAHRLVNDRDEAADITQAVFVKMAQNLWRFDERKRFFTWLYRITVNASIDHLRKHKRHRHESLDHVANHAASTVAGPEATLQRRQITRHIVDVAKYY